MCGLTGFLARPGLKYSEQIVRAMVHTLRMRGPDDESVWVDDTAGIALGHRRLAIVDLSPAGRQPMQSAGGRYMLITNGEIYNHADLRHDLDQSGAPPVWRGHSDTEVMLAAFEAWGIEAALKKFIGMFAFALWDRFECRLTLARDRLGEKPLYYGWSGDHFLFGSELKALCVHPSWRGEVDRDALALYMRFGYVPMPHSIWKGVRKLTPGSFLTLSVGSPPGRMPVTAYYWRARDEAISRVSRKLDDIEAIDELDFRLGRSIAGQITTDVPFGAFLSGGVDSSVIVALLQTQSMRPVQTFSIGFDEISYNEATYARAIAAHLGADHTEVYLTSSDALTVIPQLPEIFDEPFGDSSQIPTYIVAAIAQQQVKVCLAGDGGDELFGGYNRHFFGRAIWPYVRLLPREMRLGFGCLLRAVSPATWARLVSLLPVGMRQPMLGDRLHKLANIIDAKDANELYRRFVSQILEPTSLVIGGTEASIWADEEAVAYDRHAQGINFSERMMFHDLVGYMADDILTKVDRASMAWGLEARLPFLDFRLLEFAWSLPLSMKIRQGQGKWVLRQVLDRYVPATLVKRPKQGFAIPLDTWLRGPLRDWAESLLDESRIRQEGFLNPEPIQRKWREHLSGRRNWQYFLWNILMFQCWRERWA